MVLGVSVHYSFEHLKMPQLGLKREVAEEKTKAVSRRLIMKDMCIVLRNFYSFPRWV